MGTLQSQTAMGTLVVSKYDEESGIISYTYENAQLCKCMGFIEDIVKRIDGIQDLGRDGSTILLYIEEERRDDIYKIGDSFLREAAKIKAVKRKFDDTELSSAMAVSADIRAEH